MFRTLDRRTRKPVYGAFRSSVPLPPLSHFGLGVLGGLAVENFGLGLALYSDRLEVISPGILPNGITAERMRAGCRVARNELLKEVMRDYGYLDSIGMGVPRMIIRGMRGHNGTEPDLTEEEDRFIVRLWKEKSR